MGELFGRAGGRDASPSWVRLAGRLVNVIRKPFGRPFCDGDASGLAFRETVVWSIRCGSFLVAPAARMLPRIEVPSVGCLVSVMGELFGRAGGRDASPYRVSDDQLLENPLAEAAPSRATVASVA